MIDILFSDDINGLLGGVGYFLVDVDPGIICGNVSIADMSIVPGKAQDLVHTQQAGKGQIHRQVKSGAFASIQRLADGVYIPDIALVVTGAGQNGVVERILGNQLPADCLLERAAQELDDLLYVGIRQVLGRCSVGLGTDSRRFAQR